jgi:TrpR-related protein YerC/YecD
MENDEQTIDLYEALLLLEDRDEAYKFFKDLCTPQEISALTERWRVCQLLERGDLSYREINKITGASLTTIGRVSRFLKDEPYYGYQTMLKKITKKQEIK